MTVNLADAPAFPVRTLGKEVVLSRCSIAVGGAGATTETADDAKWTAAAFNSGLSALTFPACPSGRLRVASIVSSGSTVTEGIFTAVDVTAGTATLRTSKAGVATTPASGNTIIVELIGEVAP